MRPIAFIDNFISEPVNHCVNSFSEKLLVPTTYHQPARFGFQSLESMQNPQAVVILGSASHIGEQLDWQKKMGDWVDLWCAAKTPILGICFGHQLLAHHFGGEVGYHSHPVENVKAVRRVSLEHDLWHLNSGTELLLPYAHEQIVTKLPRDFISLASCENFSCEIIQHKSLPIYSLQAHPESSSDFISKITQDTEFRNDSEKVLGDGLEILRGFLNFSSDY